VPVTKAQSAVLKAIADSRDPESYVAGGLPINRAGPRFSEDIGIFHDREERVARAGAGHWPTAPDITSAMLEKLQQPT